MRSRIQKMLGYSGRIAQAIASLWLLGWLQSRDPDCVLDTGVLAQLRMCETEIAGAAASASMAHLPVIILLFTIGSLLVFRSRPKAS